MASKPPQRPKRRPKNMSFRSLPPLPPPPDPPPPPLPKSQPPQPQKVFISNQSHLLVGVQSVNHLLENNRKSVHRKWVKLRTQYEMSDELTDAGSSDELTDDGGVISASTIFFRLFCDQVMKHNGCEIQEISVWLDDHEFCEGEGSKS